MGTVGDAGVYMGMCEYFQDSTIQTTSIHRCTRVLLLLTLMCWEEPASLLYIPIDNYMSITKRQYLLDATLSPKYSLFSRCCVAVQLTVVNGNVSKRRGI